jgi:NADH-quinone oxidoreductase subunit M
MDQATLLMFLVLVPLAGAFVVGLLPREAKGLARGVAISIALVELMISLGLLWYWNPAKPMQFEQVVPWIKSLGITWHVGVDGFSVWLVLLTTFLTPIVMLSSIRSVEDRVKEYMICFLVLEAGMVGSFVALDLFLFYVFWELSLVPMYFIVGIWGAERRVYAAIKFFLYTMAGSLLMLAAILFVYFKAGMSSFDLAQLKTKVLPAGEQWLPFLAFALAFAIKVPMFPFHTWLPDAHVQAPTAGSVMLAAVMLKMGCYGFLRWAFPLFPAAAVDAVPWIGVLATVGITYGALVSYAQKDLKKLIAYSSVSHLGFVMLGIASMDPKGVEGAVFQMIAHGVSTGALFLLVGVLYDRRHTKLLDEFGGLARVMPRFATVFGIIVFASIGLPGLCGFVGEFLTLLGSYASPMPWMKWMSIISATGVILGAVYLLWAYQKIAFGPVTREENKSLPDLDWREATALVPLCVLALGMGLYPKPILGRMHDTTRAYISEVKGRALQARRAPVVATATASKAAPQNAGALLGKPKAPEAKPGATK